MKKVAGSHFARHDSFVSSQCIAVTQRTGDHIARMQNAKAAMNVFELIVNAFLATHSADDDGAWPRLDRLAERNLPSQVQITCNGADFIEMNSHRIKASVALQTHRQHLGHAKNFRKRRRLRS